MTSWAKRGLTALGALAVACSLLTGSCAGTETGNPPLRAALLADVPDGSGGVTVDTVYVTLTEARFSAGTDCSMDGPVVAAPPFANIVPPTGVDLALPDGAPSSYCFVRLEIARAEPPLAPGVPPELANHDVLVAGRRADGRRFRVLSRMDREVDVRALAAAFAGDPSTKAVVIAMDVGHWLSGVDLDSATPGADGVVQLDELTAPADVATFDANFATSFAVYQDADGNGDLDASERARGPIAMDR